MKKISTIIIVMFALVASTYAQKVSKFGYLNSSELISLMPETAKADSAIDKYTAERKQRKLRRKLKQCLRSS